MKPLTDRHLDIMRRHMVEMIDIKYDLLSEEIGKSEVEPRLRKALLAVPRHLFVPAELAVLSYQDTPLPLGFDKTISQPFIGALMLDLLDVQPGHDVLEVGTGLGYQAALLAQLGARVWSVEIVEEFASEAKIRLIGSSHDGISIRVGDGSRGWSDYAPFDRILVTAAAREPPPALVEQLDVGGRMVIPLGDKDGVQKLSLVHKTGEDAFDTRGVMDVRFTELETVI